MAGPTAQSYQAGGRLVRGCGTTQRRIVRFGRRAGRGLFARGLFLGTCAVRYGSGCAFALQAP